MMFSSVVNPPRFSLKTLEIPMFRCLPGCPSFVCTSVLYALINPIAANPVMISLESAAQQQDQNEY